jgi:hypothetical protein
MSLCVFGPFSKFKILDHNRDFPRSHPSNRPDHLSSAHEDAHGLLCPEWPNSAPARIATRRIFMTIFRFSVILCLPCIAVLALAGGPNPTDAPAPPKLEHFDPTFTDSSLDPCTDFYKYACSKWQAANPIPADQVAWGTGSGLQYWNENILKETMDSAASATGNQTPVQRKIGSYWQACSNVDALNKAGLKDLSPELESISRLKSKSELAVEIAHLHKALPGAWQQDDNQTDAVLFGFASQPDFDDASTVIAALRVVKR